MTAPANEFSAAFSAAFDPATRAAFYVCEYCGTNGAAVLLQRSDEAVVANVPRSERADEHAPDCPLYRATVQPYRVPGPGLVRA